jgi:septum formation protein
MTRVILASASPRRRELLAALTPEFEVHVSNAPEEPVTGNPIEGATMLARRKARMIAELEPDAVVIGADTVVHDGTRDYAKPADEADARAMLRALRGREHRVVTGVALLYQGLELTAASSSRVTLARMSDAAIAAYVASGRPLDKAGAYAIQDEDVPTVERFDGCYCSIMGLPLWALRSLLQQAGLAPGDPVSCYHRCATCPERT